MKHYLIIALLAVSAYAGSKIGAYQQQCETALTGFVDRRNIKIAEFID